MPAILNKLYKKIRQSIRNSSLPYRILFKAAYSYKKKWLYRGVNTPVVNVIFMKRIQNLLGGEIRCILSGGAPLDPNIQEFLRLTLNCPVLQGYGLTETSCSGTLTDCDDLSSGHVGGPVACALIKLVDWEEGGYMIADEPFPRGEVWIGGPSVALGYYQDVERTEEEFHQRGYIRWYSTGDIGRLRHDGSLVIIDRKKDIIKLQTGEYVSLGMFK